MDDRPLHGLTFLGRFTVTSALLAAVFAIALGSFVGGRVTEAALNEAAATTVQVADSLLSPYLVKGDFNHPIYPARMYALDRLIRPHLVENGIEEVRLWSTDHIIVYSNDPAEAGTTTPRTAEIEAALLGRPVAAIRFAESSPTLAVYAPVRLAGTLAPTGVYEVNMDARPLLARVHEVRLRTWLYVLIGTVVLYGSLIGLVYRASGTLFRQQRALHAAFEGTIRALAAAIDAKDSYTGGHSSEVSRHAEAIARAMRLSERDVQAVRIAGYLHDLGKIGIPDHVLRKKGPLNEDDWTKVRRHSLIGYRILEPVPVDEHVKLAVRHNHERWDGRGYPDGLAGSAIPIHARILMVADAYEAMTSNRPYRRALEPREALRSLEAQAGTQFDPEVVRVFITLLGGEPAIRAARAAQRAEPEPGPLASPSSPPP